MQSKRDVTVTCLSLLLCATSCAHARLGGFSNKHKKIQQHAPAQAVAMQPAAPPHKIPSQKEPVRPVQAAQYQQPPTMNPQYLADQSGLSDTDLLTLTKQNKYLRDQVTYLEKESNRLQQQNKKLSHDKQKLQKRKRRLMAQLVALQDQYS